jgi:hypothetical protein
VICRDHSAVRREASASLLRRWPLPERLLAALAVVMIVWGGVTARAAQAGVAKPSLKPPEFGSVSGDDYYPLLLEWTRVTHLGSVGAEVTYLDPRLAVAEAKNATNSIASQRAAIKQALAGFPGLVKVQVTFTAPDKAQLTISAWRVSLTSSRGDEVAATRAKVGPPPVLGSSASGQGWQQTVIYTFPNKDGGLLPPKAVSLSARVSGPSGHATVLWAFAANALPKPASPTAYVATLKWVLVGVCVLLACGLAVTRPPREFAT